MTVPSTTQLVTDALRELAEAEREWRARCDNNEDSSPSFSRVQRAEDRLHELARVLFPARAPAKATRRHKPRGEP